MLKPSAAQLKAWRALKKRDGRESQGLFLAEGEHLAAEALSLGKARALLFAAGRQQRYAALADGFEPVYILSDSDFQSLCDTRTPQGIAALCLLPGNCGLEDLGPRLIALEQVQDPGNVGTILRGIDAAAFTGLLMDSESADAFSPKALRASMGAVLRVPVRRCLSLPSELADMRGYDIIAASLDGTPFYERPPLSARFCILIGNEGAGLSEETKALATLRLKLPMPGRAESLNAAVAASVMMYDFVRTGESPGRGKGDVCT